VFIYVCVYIHIYREINHLIFEQAGEKHSPLFNVINNYKLSHVHNSNYLQYPGNLHCSRQVT
jgi:hypothetical protein